MSNLYLQNMSNSSVILRLSKIMKDDIEFITTFLKKEEPKSSIADLFNVLLEAKKQIRSKLLDNSFNTTRSPGTPSKMNIMKYQEEQAMPSSSEQSLINIVADVEKDQMRFVQKRLLEKGLPLEIKVKLEEILSIYVKTLNQLEQSRKGYDINLAIIQI